MIGKWWSPEQIAEVLRLRDQGLSASQIAGHFPGNPSRNSILGLIHRNTPAGSRAPPRAPRPPKAPQAPKSPRPRTSLPPTPPPPVRAPENPLTAILWIDRTLAQCAHLLTDAHAVDDFTTEMMVCGAPVREPGESYCRWHHSLFYTPRTGPTRKEFITVRRFAET